MKKNFLLVLLCMMASVLPAQKKMYVWQGNTPVEFEVLTVDSVTFADAVTEPAKPLPETLSGVFSVSADKQVQFSRGNLQYTQSTQTWAFAAQQYEILGTANFANGALADKIDLFGWSGSTATAQWGVSTSQSNASYSGDFADWGKNIGDGTTWRTLTKDEWMYLLKTRTNASTLMGVARINLNADGSEYANGLIFLPDNWQAPDGVTFKSGLTESGSQAYADYQTFTLEEWSKLETAGAVFLPASGYRRGTDMWYKTQGYYWSSSSDNPSYNWLYWAFNFTAKVANIWNHERYYGSTVRLVRDMK